MSTNKDNFYLRLRDERIRLGMSQASIAEKCGVSRIIWGKYENGASLPGTDVLIELAGLGANLEYLLNPQYQDSANNSLHTINPDASEEILTTYHQADSAGKEALIAVVKLIKSKM